MVEPLNADPPGRLEDPCGAEHVGAEEPHGVDDGEAVVRLGREVDDDVDAVVLRSTASIRSRSAMSPCTNAMRSPMSARLARLPA